MYKRQELQEADVATAVSELKTKNLVRESSGSRVTRYEHNFQRGIGVPEQSAVLLGLLMLRGPQTAGELRINSERWYRFADISSVDAFLEELQDRSADKGGPLVVKLPRAPGAREQRWACLLYTSIVRAADGAGPLAKHHRLGRHSNACFGRVVGVVEADADELAHLPHARAQPQVLLRCAGHQRQAGRAQRPQRGQLSGQQHIARHIWHCLLYTSRCV